MPKTQATKRAINTSQSSSTYWHLHSTTYRTDFVYWNVYAMNYYTHPYWNYYPWMPYWMWHSNNKESVKVKQSVKQKHMKWIKVSDKTIAVPEKLYKVIKVGDEVELTDNTHITINGKSYSR